MSKKSKIEGILFIILDAYRADYLGYQNSKSKGNVSPNIDKFVKESILFKNSYSPGPTTYISLPKIFSEDKDHPPVGPHSLVSRLKDYHKLSSPQRFRVKIRQMLSETLHPAIKKWIGDMIYAIKRKGLRKIKFNFLNRSFVEDLQTKLITCCIGANPFLDLGFQRGFDEFKNFIGLDIGREFFGQRDIEFVHPKKIIKEALEFRERVGGNFFLYMHFLQPHAPYVEDGESLLTCRQLQKLEFFLKFKSEKEKITKRVEKAYLNTVKFIDRHMKKIFDAFEKSLIILTSDHGELLGEYDKLQHPPLMVDELLRVPFIIGGSIPEKLRGKIYKKYANNINIGRFIRSLLKKDFALSEKLLKSIVLA